MALLWVLFGDRCDYYCNIYKIHAIMDLPEVQQLCSKFTSEIVRRITWAIIDDGRSFFNTVLTQQDFDRWGVIAFPQPFLAGVLENIHFCNPIQQGTSQQNGWVRPGITGQKTHGAHRWPRADRVHPRVEGGTRVVETLVEEAVKALEWEGVAAHRNETLRDSEELLPAV